MRRQLAKEIVTLRSVPAVDTTGAISRIQAVQDQITKLEWTPRTLPKQAVQLEEVAEGTGAMQAYAKMLYSPESKNNPQVKNQWAELLKNYCKLDTMAMVIIFKYWLNN